MSYAVTLYNNTGFEGNNIPANKSVLEGAAKSTIQLTLEIVQDYPLTQIDIPGTFDDYKDVDFCLIGNYFYQAFPAPMISNDGARLYLTFRGLTGSGGNFKIVQGTTSRTTRHTGDTFGAYTQEDPLTTPVRPLELEFKTILTDNVWAYVVISSLDFTQAEGVGYDDNGTTKFRLTFPGKTFTDPDDPEKSVTVPYVPGNSTTTQFNANNVSLLANPGTRVYTQESFEKMKGIIRSLGLEGSVYSYVIPLTGATVAAESTQILSGSTVVDTVGWYSAISSALKTEETFDPNYATVANKRVLYGQYNRWGMLTAAGDKGEFNIEEIIPPGYTSGAVNALRLDDLRPDGKPFFRYEYLLGNNDTDYFFVRAVQGAPWQSNPIVWAGASGNWLSNYNYGMDMTAEAAGYQRSQNVAARNIQRAGQDAVIGMGQRTLQAGSELLDISNEDYNPVKSVTSWASDMAQSVISYGRNVQDYTEAKAYNDAVYSHNRDRELVNYGYSQSVVEPTIANPVKASLVRDIMQNGVLVYRYKYSDYDVKRIDRLLTMYGYAVTRPVELTDIFPTDKTSGFEYLECQGIQLTSDTIPAWELSLIQDELQAGVRIWWQRPDPSLYETEETNSG